MPSLLVGFGLGLFVAAQIGPVSLLIVRSVVRGNFRVGLAMAAAVSLVDLMYAALGLAGVGRALDAADGVGTALGFVGAIVIAAIGLRTLWTGFRARLGLETDEEVATPRRAFATALAATALNPLTIAPVDGGVPCRGRRCRPVVRRHDGAARRRRPRIACLVHGLRGRDRARAPPARAERARRDRRRCRRRTRRLRGLPRPARGPRGIDAVQGAYFASVSV